MFHTLPNHSAHSIQIGWVNVETKAKKKQSSYFHREIGKVIFLAWIATCAWLLIKSDRLNWLQMAIDWERKIENIIQFQSLMYNVAKKHTIDTF